MPSSPPSKREILVFEPDVEGHSQEWLQHLVDFVADNDQAAAIAVLAPPALCATLSRAMPIVADHRIRFIAMTPREVRLCGHRSLSLAAFARWWVMRRYLRRSGADMGFFLCLDLLSLPLAFGLGTRGKPLAGILFRPSVHYAAFGNYRPGLGEWLRDVRKDLLYRMMLRNPAVATILSPDVGLLLDPTPATPPPNVIPRAFFAGLFKIPTLWGVKDTAPYFHDNGAKTLRDAVAHYKRFFNFTEEQDPVGSATLGGRITLTDTDVNDIVAYLKLLGPNGIDK